MSRLSSIVEVTIHDGQLDAFKQMAQRFVATVQAEEPGTLTYQWRIAEDGKTCLIHEVYESEEALMTHLGNVGPSMSDLFAISSITRVEALGSAVGQEVRAALSDFGPRYFLDFAGFDR